MALKDLKTLREVGESMEREENGIPLDLTIDRSVKIFASFYESVKHMLAETEELFRPVREAELIEFQARLQRLDEWRKQNGSDIESAQTGSAVQKNLSEITMMSPVSSVVKRNNSMMITLHIGCASSK